jgi:RHS repeat-associated protein
VGRRRIRAIVVALVAVLLFEAGATSPSASAGQPNAGPQAESPRPSSPPEPSVSPRPDPTLSPEPVPSPGEPTGVERVDLRSANSKTFERADGSFVTQFFLQDVFYQPEGRTDWQPIDTTLRPSNQDGIVASVDHGPAQLSLAAADSASGFLTLTGDGASVSFSLPDGVQPGRIGAQPTITDGGKAADYMDFLPGGIGLRILPQTDGFKAFLVLPNRPQQTEFSFVINALGLDLVAMDDGSIEIRDQQGSVVGQIPHPFLIDSSEVEGRGGGQYSEAVSQRISKKGNTYLLTLSVDPAYLDTAVYPVYLDPSTTNFPTGSTNVGDTFAREQNPNTNYGSFQMPGSPYYHDMWVGKEPGTSFYARTFIKFNSLQEILGAVHIDSATLELFPWWQYYHYQWRDSYLQRVSPSVSWTASTLTWNNQPGVDSGHPAVTVSSKEGVTTDASHNWDVTDYVHDVVNNNVANNGWRISKDDTGAGDWKRFIQSNENSADSPNLKVVWTAFVPTPGYPSGGGETSSRNLTWFHSADAPSTTAFEAELLQSNCTTQIITSGTVASSANSWMIPTSTSLTDGTTYCWQVRAKYGVNESFSAWSSSTTFVYRQGATLGLPGHNTFESFGLGSGDSASVNVSTGNLVMTHPIVNLPMRGGDFGLALTYNSQSIVNAGTGQGWRLNVMRRLSELGTGNVVLTAGDGSNHTFAWNAPVSGVITYSSPATVYATLRKNTTTSTWTLTYRDQSVDTFTQSGSEGLLATQADRFGNAVDFTYYTGSNRLKDATDPAGRVVDFAWDTSASPARLTSITDWAYVSSGIVQATSTGARRHYRLFYDSNGYLAGWSDPLDTSGNCPTVASHRTCLEYDSEGLLTKINKRLTPAVISNNQISTGNELTVTSQILYRGNEVKELKDALQYAANPPASGTTFARTASDRVQVVRQGDPAATTTYGLLAVTDDLGRVQSVWRRLASTDIEQRTTWDATYRTERASVTENYGGLLSTPARTVTYSYWASSMGMLKKVIEPLTNSTDRWTEYTYNSRNDLTELKVSLDGASSDSTTTRYCFGDGTCDLSDAYTLAPWRVVQNWIDGSKGGTDGNSTDVTTDYQYDAHGLLTRETRWNYDSAGTLLDSRATGYVYDSWSRGERIKVIANFVDGLVNGGLDVSPDPTTGAYTDLTSTYGFDTAGNVISSADPRRAIASSPGLDDYVSRFEYSALNEKTKTTAPRSPLDGDPPRSATSFYDEFGSLREQIDFGGLVTATQFDVAGIPVATFEDQDGDSGSDPAATTSQMTYDAGSRVLTEKDRRQVSDSSRGVTDYDYDSLGRQTQVTQAAGGTSGDELVSVSSYDALNRQTAIATGDVSQSGTGRLTTYVYDLGGRVTQQNDEFTCSGATYDYRDLLVIAVEGLNLGSPCTGTGTRTTTNTYDGLGRLTRTDATGGDYTITVRDGADNLLTSTAFDAVPNQTTDVAYAVNALDLVYSEVHSSDGSSSRTMHDPAGNATDLCYWNSASDEDCTWGGSFTNVPTRQTQAAYDARNQRILLRDAATNSTTAYSPVDNYAVSAFYLPISGSKEHQTLYSYDERHRLTFVRHQVCMITSDHSCPTPDQSTGWVDYDYDNNSNRTLVEESADGSANPPNWNYCYDAQNRLQYRQADAVCTTTHDEQYVFDSAGNRTSSTEVFGGSPATTKFGYDGDFGGRLCKVGASGPTDCSSSNVAYDAASRISSWNGWWFTYDEQGRLVTACKSQTCSSTYDKVTIVYDGEGRRSEIRTDPAGGTPEITTEFRYQGDSIIEERLADGTVTRQYLVDELGTIAKVIIPAGQAEAGSYVVTWNGHGDAMALWRIDGSGALSLANSFRYTTWGTPTTTTHNGIGDLGFRFLYVGAHDVQWDNFSGLGLYYMSARHYSPSLGRFLQPDPSQEEANLYAYTSNNPVTAIDPTGLRGSIDAIAARMGGWVIRVARNVRPWDGGLFGRLFRTFFPSPTRVMRGGSVRGNQAGIRQGKDVSPNTKPDFNNPANPPGPGWVWVSKSGAPPGSKDGAWYKPSTGEQLRPDFHHAPPIPPHYDYLRPGVVPPSRWFADGTLVPK